MTFILITKLRYGIHRKLTFETAWEWCLCTFNIYIYISSCVCTFDANIHARQKKVSRTGLFNDEIWIHRALKQSPFRWTLHISGAKDQRQIFRGRKLRGLKSVLTESKLCVKYCVCVCARQGLTNSEHRSVSWWANKNNIIQKKVPRRRMKRFWSIYNSELHHLHCSRNNNKIYCKNIREKKQVKIDMFVV